MSEDLNSYLVRLLEKGGQKEIIEAVIALSGAFLGHLDDAKKTIQNQRDEIKQLKEAIAVIRVGIFTSTWVSAGIRDYLIQSGLADEKKLSASIKNACATTIIDEFLDEKLMSTETKKDMIH
jgi:hypothetical protein